MTIDYKDVTIIMIIRWFRLFHLAGKTLDRHPTKGYGVLNVKVKKKAELCDTLCGFSQVMTFPGDWDRNVKQEEDVIQALRAGTYATICPFEAKQITQAKLKECWMVYTDEPCPDWLLANFS